MRRYRFVVSGVVTERLMVLLPTFTYQVENGETALTMDVIDQAHLAGIFQELSDFGLETISVTPAEPQRTASGDGSEGRWTGIRRLATDHPSTTSD